MRTWYMTQFQWSHHLGNARSDATSRPEMMYQTWHHQELETIPQCLPGYHVHFKVEHKQRLILREHPNWCLGVAPGGHPHEQSTQAEEKEKRGQPQPIITRPKTHTLHIKTGPKKIKIKCKPPPLCFLHIYPPPCGAHKVNRNRVNYTMSGAMYDIQNTKLQNPETEKKKKKNTINKLHHSHAPIYSIKGSPTNPKMEQSWYYHSGLVVQWPLISKSTWSPSAISFYWNCLIYDGGGDSYKGHNHQHYCEGWQNAWQLDFPSYHPWCPWHEP